MQRLLLDEIREIVVARLPPRYEPLQLTFHGGEPRLHPDGRHVIIGDDYGTEICVSLEDGAVYSIDPQKMLPTRLVNSGIEQLAAFIEVCRSYANRPKVDSVRGMWNELRAIDARAFADPGNWWALVLEQVEQGLL